MINKNKFVQKLKNISLKARLTASLVTVICLMGLFCIYAVWNFSENVITSYYNDTADRLAGTVAVAMNAQDIKNLKGEVLEIYENADEVAMSDEWGSEAFEEYTALFKDIEESPEFVRLQKAIRRYQDINDVDCIYLCIVDPVGEKVVYLVDGAYEDACPPGCVDPLYDVNKILTQEPEVGFPPYTTNSGYGWLVTAGEPVYYAGDVIAYAMVDVSMDMIRKEQRHFVLTIAGVILVLGIGIVMLGFRIIRKYIADPVDALAHTARNYCQESSDMYHYNFRNLSLGTNDEIGQLLTSMQQMERDMNHNISRLLSTKSELEETMVKAEVMTEMAMTDPLTGVGSKAAYEETVADLRIKMMDPSCKFGIAMIDLNYLKYVNDNFGHEMGNRAIKSLADILKGLFSHSNIYRIGGDEFVAILKDRDHRHSEELMGELKEAVKGTPDGSPSHDVVSAAVGYAEYGDGDGTYEDVFNRADEAMYRDKELKHAVRKGA